MARELAEELPRLKADASGALVPDLRAAAAIIYDPETNEILWEENSQTQRSIASITKVMTATVFLENNPDLSQPVTIARSDVLRASTTFLRRTTRSRPTICCTCCSSRPTTPPRGRSRASRRTAPPVSSSG